jgi:uncharacterized protein (DUF433 family)
MTEPLIVSDPKVMMGKPVVAGTRITVDLILEKLGSGEPMEAVLEAHPRLTREGILAASASRRRPSAPRWSTPCKPAPREPARGRECRGAHCGPPSAGCA